MNIINVVSDINPEIWKRQAQINGLAEFTRIVFTNKPVPADTYIFYGTSKGYFLPNKLAQRIYFVGEPSILRVNSYHFLRQFDQVLGVIPRKFLDQNNFKSTQPALPWHIGIDFSNNDGLVKLNFSEIANLSAPEINAISVITSDKIISKSHFTRFRFVQELSQIMGPELKIYGRGINPVPDKYEVLSKFRYHLALENSVQDDYWSEKLADPILALNKVFYYGASNVNKYFAKEVVEMIDINDPQKVAKQILESINNNSWEADLEYIRNAKEKVLLDYNFVTYVGNLRVSSTSKSRKHIHRDLILTVTRLIRKLYWKITLLLKKSKTN